MNKLFLIVLFLNLSFQTMAQQVLVDQKGTKISVDSSKWKLSGTNINTKNSGNVGIGNTNPTYKLDVTGKVRITDSLIVNTNSRFSDSLFVTNTISTNHFVTTGSIRAKVVRTTLTNYTVATDDYIIHFSTSAAGTITLPATATSIGRILIFSNHSGATKTLSSAYRTGSGTTTTSLANNAEIRISYDGTEWFILSN